jgi:RimJ/RimL family protein N-acetyltransferase
MTDPMDALRSFQEEFLLHEPQLRRTRLDPNLYVHFDTPNGEMRVTFVRFEGKTVTALVSFCEGEPIDGMHCYNIGYAVAEAYRNQGRAKEIVSAAIAELLEGSEAFYVNATVAAGNVASQRVAAQVISDTPDPITEHISGLPAFRYVRRFDRPTNPPSSC